MTADYRLLWLGIILLQLMPQIFSKFRRKKYEIGSNVGLFMCGRVRREEEVRMMVH